MEEVWLTGLTLELGEMSALMEEETNTLTTGTRVTFHLFKLAVVKLVQKMLQFIITYE